MKQLPLLFLLFFCTTLVSKTGESPLKVYTVRHINPHSPVIDGRTDDIVWHKAAQGHDFLQLDPDEGKPATERTYFKIMFDEKNLYVLIRAFDSEPDKIATRVSRRDDVDNSDVVGIIVDSYYDHRTAYEFSVNAAGVQSDGTYSNDSQSEDKSWDPVWETRTTIDDSGWTAEMRIPFSQLRFASKNRQTWGVEVYRYIHRKQELAEWQLIPKDVPGFVSYFGKLEGLRGISVPRRIELLPYSVSKFHSYEKEAGNPFLPGHDTGFTGGLDGKIGLTGNMTVDFTVNPDFGQVEADPSEVNLSAFETFFEEKRPFFVEGKNIFQFPLAIGDGDFARETLFYSRRIGRRPHYEPDVDDPEYLSMPEQTAILGAAKLSGKTAGGFSIGVLDALTAAENARISLNGIQRIETVEPLTNYFVGRLQKDYRNGGTSLGGMFTSTNRNINHAYLDFINRSAYTGGIDFSHQWNDKTYFLDLKLAGSYIRGHKDAILEAQTASARYFQRPDANYLTLDSNRTSLSGHGGSFAIGRQGNGKWQYAVGGVWRSPGFELNDVGYLRQADQSMEFVWVGYRLYNPVGIFRRISLNLNQWTGWNFGGENIFNGGNVNGGGQFKNYWGFWGGINRQGDGLSASALRGGPSLRYEGGWNDWFDIYTDSRKSWQVELSGSDNRNDDGISGSHNLSLAFYARPGNRFSLSVQPFYNIGVDNLQYVDTVEKAGGDCYIMAKLNQKTAGIVFRLNYSMTPKLSIQYYGQPFIAAGAYGEFKRITTPRAARNSERYRNFAAGEISYSANDEQYQVDENGDGMTDYVFDLPDFNFKQFRSNLVIRWEYHPGSQVYLVWSQGLTQSDEFGDFSLRRDARDLFDIHPDNVFLVKVNHWFSI